MTSRTKARERRRMTLPMAVGSKRSLMLMSLLLAVVTMLAIPASAFAADDNSVNMSCAAVNPASSAANTADYSTCLPAGRWGASIGTISSRTEPANGPAGALSNLGAWMGRTTRLIMPNMLLSLSQLCWSLALSLNQFATAFDPAQQFGAQIDRAAGSLARAVTAGSIPSLLIVAGLCALVAAMAYGAGRTRSVVKRILVSVVCLAALMVTGAAAANTPADGSAPAKGSPWWVIQGINQTMSKVTGSTNNWKLFAVSDHKSSMAHNNTTNPNCQDYLQAMHDMYQQSENASDITDNISTMWEETALRSWVTMQWGGLQASGTTSEQVAQNSQQAYCHVLDMTTNTNANIQTELTNKAYGLKIDPKTGKWLFSPRGWVSLMEPGITDAGKGTYESSDSVRITRAAVFWETCGTTSKNPANPDIRAREGWSLLVNNLADKGSGEIKNGEKVIRPASDGQDTQDVFSTVGNTSFKNLINIPDGHNATEAVAAVRPACVIPLTNQLYGGDERNQRKQTAALAYMFDIPNVEAVWNEANLDGVNDPNSANNGVRTTLDYFYGNKDVDTLGAFGSLLGAISCMLVFGAGALLQILAKVMLMVMGLFLVAALAVNMVPVGDTAGRTLNRWGKTALNLCMVGAIYALLINFIMFLCRLQMNMVSGMANSFLSNAIIGLSPFTGLVCIIMFCKYILKIGNPFNARSMLSLAGGNVLASGLDKGMQSVKRRMRRASNARWKDRHKAKQRAKMHAQHPTAGSAANRSEEIRDRAARQQDAIAVNGVRAVTPLFKNKEGRRMDGQLAKAAGKMHAVNKDMFAMDAQAWTDAVTRKHPTWPAAFATTYGVGKATVMAAKRVGLAGAYGAAGVASGVQSMVKDPNVRQAAKKVGRGMVTAAMMSNPVTMPAGVLVAGVGAMRGVRALASSMRRRQNEPMELTHPLDETRVDPSNNGDPSERAASEQAELAQARQDAQEATGPTFYAEPRRADDAHQLSGVQDMGQAASHSGQATGEEDASSSSSRWDRAASNARDNWRDMRHRSSEHVAPEQVQVVPSNEGPRPGFADKRPLWERGGRDAQESLGSMGRQARPMPGLDDDSAFDAKPSSVQDTPLSHAPMQRPGFVDDNDAKGSE